MRPPCSRAGVDRRETVGAWKHTAAPPTANADARPGTPRGRRHGRKQPAQGTLPHTEGTRSKREMQAAGTSRRRGGGGAAAQGSRDGVGDAPRWLPHARTFRPTSRALTRRVPGGERARRTRPLHRPTRPNRAGSSSRWTGHRLRAGQAALSVPACESCRRGRLCASPPAPPGRRGSPSQGVAGHGTGSEPRAT